MQHKHSSGCCMFSSPKKKSYVATKEIPCHWIYTSQSYCVYERERGKGKRLTQVRVDLFHELKWKIFANLFKSLIAFGVVCDGEDFSIEKKEAVGKKKYQILHMWVSV